jgi:hypothetical protein
LHAHTPLLPSGVFEVQRDTSTVKLLQEAGAEVEQPFLLDIFPPRQGSLFATKVLLIAFLLLPLLLLLLLFAAGA